MLVAISGSQGSGKSTLIKHLREKSSYKVLDLQNARGILKSMGLTLKEVNENKDLQVEFQKRILENKYLNELEHIDSDEIVFVERTYIDSLAYTIEILGKDEKYKEFLDEYEIACLTYTNHYKKIFFIANIFNNIEADGVRNHYKHNATMMNYTMFGYYSLDLQSDTVEVIPKSCLSVDDRIEFILNNL